MRHSSIAVTFDVYGHLFPGYLDDVLDQLEDDLRTALAVRGSLRRHGNLREAPS